MKAATETVNRLNFNDQRLNERNVLETVPMNGHGESQQEPMNIIKPLLTAKNRTNIGTWNVRTLYETGKLAQLIKEMQKYNIEILGISEMRWTGNGTMQSDGCQVLYSGGEKHEKGVGLILSERSKRALTDWQPISERIIQARFKSKHANCTVIQVYAPTNSATEEEKDSFYFELQGVIDETPRHDILFLMGDFNAKVGGSREGIEQAVGPHTTGGELNENGQRLVDLCLNNNLILAKSFFRHKDIYKKTWVSPDGRTKNEIDFICINKRWRSTVTNARVYRGAEIHSDHYLVKAIIKVKLETRTKKPENTRPPKIDFQKMKNQAVKQRYQIELKNRFEALKEHEEGVEQCWKRFKDTVNGVAKEVIGIKRGTKKEEWISDDTWETIDRRKEQKLRMLGLPEVPNYEKEQYKIIDKQVKRKCRNIGKYGIMKKQQWRKKQLEKMIPKQYSKSPTC